MPLSFPFTPEYEAFQKYDKKLEFAKLIGFIAMVYSGVMLAGIFLSWIFIADTVNWSRVGWSFGLGFVAFIICLCRVAYLTPKVQALKQPFLNGVSRYMERREEDIVDFMKESVAKEFRP